MVCSPVAAVSGIGETQGLLDMLQRAKKALEVELASEKVTKTT